MKFPTRKTILPMYLSFYRYGKISTKLFLADHWSLLRLPLNYKDDIFFSTITFHHHFPSIQCASSSRLCVCDARHSNTFISRSYCSSLKYFTFWPNFWYWYLLARLLITSYLLLVLNGKYFAAQLLLLWTNCFELKALWSWDGCDDALVKSWEGKVMILRV